MSEGDWLFTVFVPGVPMPKGSPMAYLANRAALADPRVKPRLNIVEGRRSLAKARYVGWTETVGLVAARQAARTGLREPLDGPLIFCGRFYLPRPKSRRRAVYCVSKPDYDKLMRCVWDELQRAGVIAQDARICKIGEPNGKYYECDGYPPGVWVGIRSAIVDCAS